MAPGITIPSVSLSPHDQQLAARMKSSLTEPVRYGSHRIPIQRSRSKVPTLAYYLPIKIGRHTITNPNWYALVQSRPQAPDPTVADHRLPPVTSTVRRRGRGNILADVLPTRPNKDQTEVRLTPFRRGGENRRAWRLTRKKDDQQTPIHDTMQPGMKSGLRRAIPSAPMPDSPRQDHEHLHHAHAMHHGPTTRPDRQGGELSPGDGVNSASNSHGEGFGLPGTVRMGVQAGTPSII